MSRLGRGTGLIVEPRDVSAEANRRHPLGAVFTPSAPRPASVSYAALLDKTLDQGPLEACVGCAFSTTIYLRAKISGSPIPRPSPKLIYDLGRSRVSPDQPLVDGGCLPLDAVAASSEEGLVPEDAWPLFLPPGSPLAGIGELGTPWINVPPDLTVYREAIDARVVGYLRADDGDVVALLEAALAAGHVPAWGMVVRNDYGDVRDEVYDVPAGASPDGLPGHMQAIVGYDPDAFIVASSWGEGHGDLGIVRVAKRFVADPAWSFSRIVVTSAPGRLAA